MRRVVITGMGAVSALGNTLEETWQGIKEGKSGLGNITLFDTEKYDCKVAGEVKNFDPGMWMDKKESRKMARFTQFAVAASVQALNDAGLTKENIDGKRTSIMIGNGIGGFETWEESFTKYVTSGPSRLPPMTIPKLIPNEAAGNISMMYGIHGTSFTLATACASGTDALGIALDQIRSGRCDVCIAGGTESTITGFGIASFQILHTLPTTFNDNPEKASRPFDKDRSGFVMGEGAGILILEEYEHAVARGAQIIAEICGYGNTCDAHHVTAPRPDGTTQAAALRLALDEAGYTSDDVLYINAHGTGTALNDVAETVAFKLALGDDAYKAHISSTKSAMGHLLGAAGAVEALAAILALKNSIIPPTINLDETDPECDLDYTPNNAVEADLTVAISDSLGFGGHNSCLAFRKI